MRVDPRYTTQDCSSCGYRDGKKPLSVRTWTCSKCKATHDRDINAAINILARFVPLSADMSQEAVASLRSSSPLGWGSSQGFRESEMILSKLKNKYPNLLSIIAVLVLLMGNLACAHSDILVELEESIFGSSVR
ncbi:MAG: transposase [Deinococcales bacterium]